MEERESEQKSGRESVGSSTTLRVRELTRQRYILQSQSQIKTTFCFFFSFFAFSTRFFFPTYSFHCNIKPHGEKKMGIFIRITSNIHKIAAKSYVSFYLLFVNLNFFLSGVIIYHTCCSHVRCFFSSSSTGSFRHKRTSANTRNVY